MIIKCYNCGEDASHGILKGWKDRSYCSKECESQDNMWNRWSERDKAIEVSKNAMSEDLAEYNTFSDAITEEIDNEIIAELIKFAKEK